MKINTSEAITLSYGRAAVVHEKWMEVRTNHPNATIEEIEEKRIPLDAELEQERTLRNRLIALRDAGHFHFEDDAKQGEAMINMSASIEDRQWLIEKEWDDDRQAEWQEEWVRAEVERTIKEGAMIRVYKFMDDTGYGFGIALRPRGKKNAEIHLYCHINHGGVFTEDGTTILCPYEFSMQKYAGYMGVRAATEYVRRKFVKMVEA